MSEALDGQVSPDVPEQMLASMAERFDERVHAGESEKWSQTAPNAVLLCNLLSTIIKNQRHRRPKSGTLKHSIKFTRSVPTMIVDVVNVQLVDTRDIKMLRQVAGDRLVSASFEFEQDGAKLRWPLLRLLLVNAHAEEAAIAGIARARFTSLPANMRQRAAFTIDWTDSTVLPEDRATVLRVIDEIHNMDTVMPVDMTTSIEPITSADYVAYGRTKTARGHDDSTESVSRQKRGVEQLVGYCVHVVGVPNTSVAFLDYLADEFRGVFLHATLLYPENRANDIVVPQQLLVSLRCSTALIQQSEAHAVCGAKRLCKKVYGKA